MLFFYMKFHLGFFPVLLAGVCGTTATRYAQSLYLPKLSGKFLRQKKQAELELLGAKLHDKGWRRWFFVFFYAMTPLPDTVLFTAAGFAEVRPIHTTVPFFCGKFVGDAVLIAAARFFVGNLYDFFHGAATGIGIVTGIVGASVLACILFIDWRALLERNTFRFRSRFWKRPIP